MFDTCVLGVDPGVARLGLAVVGVREKKPVVVWAGVVRTPSDLDESRRLARIAQTIRTTIDTHRPDTVAVERVMWGQNKTSALIVARVTGVVLLVAAEAGLPVEEYVPLEVKNAITGLGNAGKEQVRRALARVHGLRDVPDQPDAADAVAVAVAHLTCAKMRRLVARSGAR